MSKDNFVNITLDNGKEVQAKFNQKTEEFYLAEVGVNPHHNHVHYHSDGTPVNDKINNKSVWSMSDTRSEVREAYEKTMKAIGMEDQIDPNLFKGGH